MTGVEKTEYFVTNSSRKISNSTNSLITAKMLVIKLFKEIQIFIFGFLTEKCLKLRKEKEPRIINLVALEMRFDSLEMYFLNQCFFSDYSKKVCFALECMKSLIEPFWLYGRISYIIVELRKHFVKWCKQFE